MYVQPWQNEHTFYFIFTEDSVLRVPRLPIDVLKAIMERLPQEELRILSSACREFRKMAHNAGLSLHRTIADAAGLATFARVVQHAESKPTLLNLALTVDYRPTYYGIPSPVLRGTLLVVTRALPLLTRLRVMASRNVIESFLLALNAPAPYLHTLEVVQWGFPDRRMTTLPHNLLSPLDTSLRSVKLDVPRLASHSAVPAFNTVTSAHVTLGAQQSHFAVALLFPAVNELHLRICEAEHKVVVDISNLSLRLLAIDNACDRELEFSCSPHERAPQVSVVAYTGNSVQRHELLWPADGRGINAHLRRVTRNRYPRVALTLANRSWRSTFHLPHCADWQWYAGERTLEPMHTCRLVSLTVDEALLEALIQTPIALSELRELCIDVSAPPLTKLSHARRGESEDTERCVLGVAAAVYCALVVFPPWKLPWPVLEPFFNIILLFVVLFAAVSALKAWENMRPNTPDSRARLSCPALDSVTIFARADSPPPVLDGDMIAPLRRLLVRTRIRPTLLLAGVRLGSRVSLTTLRLRKVFRTIEEYGAVDRHLVLSHLARDCDAA
ncbi:hypothetical protein AURDEDRAFT_164919 [Auricularia subglabra TFB-10046 SS5]|nr:hypothetical protein AURDEDRAFT_164919 [Auricularia subglabra TFB-10046 SS5]